MDFTGLSDAETRDTTDDGFNATLRGYTDDGGVTASSRVRMGDEDPDPEPPYNPGDTVNGYTITHQLDRSANWLWGAKDQGGADVVLKRGKRSSDTVYPDLMILSCLCHPCIPMIQSAFEKDGYTHLVFPLYSGMDLFQLIDFVDIESRNLFAKMIGARVLDLLVLLHSHDIWHRDIKPENIMFKTTTPTFEGIIVIDFGRATVPEDSVLIRNSPYVGTPLFQAPEILKCLAGKFHPYTESIDIFALGLTLHFLQVGYDHAPPWRQLKQGMTLEQKLEALSTIQNVDFHGSTRLDPEFLDLFKQLCAMEPNDRPTASEALRHPWFDEVWDLLNDGTIDQMLAQIVIF
jgi:calcium/calmodulin-dependent protein kinase I